MEDEPIVVHRLTKDELAESLIFYRRRLAQRIVNTIIRECTRNKTTPDMLYRDVAQYTEDLANALTERLEARETGKVGGYEDV